MKISPFIFSALLTTAFASNDSCDVCKSFSTLHSARPCIGDVCSPTSRWGAALEMSWLVWQAREDGLAFALKNNPILTPAANILADVNGQLREPHFKWANAFKLNIIQEFAASWDLGARWTYYYSRSTATNHATIDATTTSGLFPLWFLPQSYLASPNIFGQARGIWHLHLNTVDFELGYHPLLTSKLGLRLHGGLKGISINQQFTVQYLDGIDDNSVTLLPSRATLRNRCLGLGPRFGFNSQWHLSKGWTLLADGAASFSLSVFNLKRKDFDRALADSDRTVYDDRSKFRESFYAYRPNLEALLGFGWDHCFGSNSQYIFNFKIAYEVQYFWDQNMMRQLSAQPISFSPYSMRGDLHCHGVTTTFKLGF